MTCGPASAFTIITLLSYNTPHLVPFLSFSKRHSRHPCMDAASSELGIRHAGIVITYQGTNDPLPWNRPKYIFLRLGYWVGRLKARKTHSTRTRTSLSVIHYRLFPFSNLFFYRCVHTGILGTFDGCCGAYTLCSFLGRRRWILFSYFIILELWLCLRHSFPFGGGMYSQRTRIGG
jgi:hypothetical protein